jgi:Ca-activated chloride channel family protein
MMFLYPNVLWAMLLPTIFLIYLISTRQNQFNKIFTKEILQKLQVGSYGMSKTLRDILFFFAILFFIVALARPVIKPQESKIDQKIIPVVIAIDVSKSMMAQDIFPNRLKLAEQKAKKIITDAKGVLVGIILQINKGGI